MQAGALTPVATISQRNPGARTCAPWKQTDAMETDCRGFPAALHHIAADRGNVRPKGQRCGCLWTQGAGPGHYWELIGVFLGVRLVICGAFTSKEPPPLLPLHRF